VRKFVIIMVSFTMVCLIAAVVLTALNRDGGAVDRSPDQWAAADGLKGEIDQTEAAPIAGIREISIVSGADDIVLHTGGAEEVRVRYHGTIRSSRRDIAAPTLRMAQKGGTVSFWLDVPPMPATWFYSRDAVLDVYLPSSYPGSLTLESSSGDIRAEGFAFEELDCEASSGNVSLRDIEAGTVSVETSSGDITVEGITGTAFSAEASSGDIRGGDIAVDEIELETLSGDTRLKDVQGDIEASASSGGIRLEEISGAGNVDAKASSGDIHMTFAEIGSELEFSTSSGSVSLWFPQDAAFGIAFDTGSGSFGSDFAVTMNKTDEDSVQGYVGSAGNTVRVRTSSGDCRINKR